MKDSYGWTALIYASSNGKESCVELLSEKESGVQDNSGWSALMWAACNGKVGCVKLLAKKEKTLRATRDYDGFPSGMTALDIAKRKGRNEIIDILSG